VRGPGVWGAHPGYVIPAVDRTPVHAAGVRTPVQGRGTPWRWCRVDPASEQFLGCRAAGAAVQLVEDLVVAGQPMAQVVDLPAVERAWFGTVGRGGTGDMPPAPQRPLLVQAIAVLDRQRHQPVRGEPRHLDGFRRDPRQHLPPPAQSGSPRGGGPPCGNRRSGPELLAALGRFNALDAVEAGLRGGTEVWVGAQQIRFAEELAHHRRGPPPGPQSCCGEVRPGRFRALLTSILRAVLACGHQ
jgi:hypothetical protein